LKEDIRMKTFRLAGSRNMPSIIRRSRTEREMLGVKNIYDPITGVPIQQRLPPGAISRLIEEGDLKRRTQTVKGACDDAQETKQS
jgi:hypothetical protein